MSIYDQPITSYANTTIHPRVIGEIIHLIDPIDVPLIARLGLDSARGKFSLNMNGKKVEWLEDEYAATSAVNNQGTTVTTTTLAITFVDASYLKVGMVLKMELEYMVIASISGEVVTVTSRAYGGTNNEQADGGTVQIVGMARKEGADVDYGHILDISAPYNYTSIYEEGVRVTGTEAALNHYAIGDMFNYQMGKKIKEQLRLLNRAFYHGVRAEGAAATHRSFGGVETFVTDNETTLTTALTKAKLDDLAKTIFDDGGIPDILVLGSGGWKTMRGLMDTSSFIQIGQENTEFGMKNIARANLFAFDNVEILIDRWCPADKAYLLDTKKIGFYTLRPFAQYDITRGGDYIAGELIGEFSLAVANDKAHGYLDTTASTL